MNMKAGWLKVVIFSPCKMVWPLISTHLNHFTQGSFEQRPIEMFALWFWIRRFLNVNHLFPTFRCYLPLKKNE